MKQPSARAIFWPGAPLALASAVLFGASTPFAKLLLGEGVNPWLLAGLLYLGSGIGLAGLQLVRRLAGVPQSEAPLRRADLPWLGLVVLSGGIAGPVLLMLGLQSTTASSASLLLNLESLATMTIAWTMFRENVDQRILIGALSILAGAVVLSWQGGPSGFGWGALLIAGACLAWAIDNNLTRKLSGADPVQITTVKGLIAGGVNLTLALAAGAHLPTPLALGGAAILVFLPMASRWCCSCLPCGISEARGPGRISQPRRSSAPRSRSSCFQSPSIPSSVPQPC